jgi:hypothetical protein
MTNVVCVYGLGLTFHVCVNGIMELIYTPCKCIEPNYISVSVSQKM